MHPDFLVGMSALAMLTGARLVESKAPTPEQLEQMRQDRLTQIAAQRAASPHVAAAEAKRARKAAKLRRIEEQSS